MKHQIIFRLFEKMNKAEINYAVLRGYLPFSELGESHDIDVLLAPEDLKKCDVILGEMGFKTPKINASSYPHIQYFLLTVDGMVKIDFVTELCFGEKGFVLQEERILNYIEKRNCIKVLRSDVALVIFMLHLAFDKDKITEKNYSRLLKFVDEYNYRKKELDNAVDWVLTFGLLINDELIRVPGHYLKSFAQRAYENGFLYSKEYVKREMKRREKACLIRYRLHRLKNKSIAIIGVDGSGKSTTVNALYNLLGDGCKIQYMGFREMETFWGKEWYASGKHFKNKFLPFLGIYLEMWHRYLKNRFSNSGIVIFDRFPWEAFDNGKGKYKAIYFVLFKVMFPKPRKVYYLHCACETSLARKNDIADIRLFQDMKSRFDLKYRNKVMSFDTDLLSTNQVIGEICKDIMGTGYYEYLF